VTEKALMLSNPCQCGVSPHLLYTISGGSAGDLQGTHLSYVAWPTSDPMIRDIVPKRMTKPENSNLWSDLMELKK